MSQFLLNEKRIDGSGGASAMTNARGANQTFFLAQRLQHSELLLRVKNAQEREYGQIKLFSLAAYSIHNT